MNNPLPKEEFYELYLKQGLSGNRIRKHFKCRNRKIADTAKFYEIYNNEERKRNLHIFRSTIMKDNLHGLKFKEEIKDKFIEEYESGLTLKEMSKKYEVKYTTIKYWARLLGLKDRTPFSYRVSQKYINGLQELIKFKSDTYELIKMGDLELNDIRELYTSWIELRHSALLLKHLIKLANKNGKNRKNKLRLKQFNIVFPESDLEFKLLKMLEDNKIKYKLQVWLENRRYDFLLIESNILIEVDGPQHQNRIEEDLIKNEIAKKNGYKLIRLNKKDLNYCNQDETIKRIEDETGKS